MSQSRRYRDFAIRYRTKIRTKLKNARHEGALIDLRAELEAAALLLRDNTFLVEYEAYAAQKQRGPDLTVTYKTHSTFNIEVRRLRGATDNDEPIPRVNRVMSILAAKVGQLPAGVANLLWLVVEEEITLDDIRRATTSIHRLAERKDDEYFSRHGFNRSGQFARQFTRLSGIVLRRPGGVDTWINPAARHPVAPGILAAIYRNAS